MFKSSDNSLIVILLPLYSTITLLLLFKDCSLFVIHLQLEGSYPELLSILSIVKSFLYPLDNAHFANLLKSNHSSQMVIPLPPYLLKEEHFSSKHLLLIPPQISLSLLSITSYLGEPGVKFL